MYLMISMRLFFPFVLELNIKQAIHEMWSITFLFTPLNLIYIRKAGKTRDLEKGKNEVAFPPNGSVIVHILI